MINRIVATLSAADRCFDPEGADDFAQRLGEALDDRRIVFSTPVMTNAGRHLSRPLAACAVAARRPARRPVRSQGDRR